MLGNSFLLLWSLWVRLFCILFCISWCWLLKGLCLVYFGVCSSLLRVLVLGCVVVWVVIVWNVVCV